MKLSSACRSEDHNLCANNGRVRLPYGKVMQCKCKCHPEPKQVKRVERDED